MKLWHSNEAGAAPLILQRPAISLSTNTQAKNTDGNQSAASLTRDTPKAEVSGSCSSRVRTPTSIREDGLHSHAVYLALGQPSLVHEHWQHLHHGLFDGFHHQVHPCARIRSAEPSHLLFLLVEDELGDSAL